VRVVAAALVADAGTPGVNEWGAALSANGHLTVHRITDLLETGSLPEDPGSGDQPAEILDFVTFRAPSAAM
jgi:hypothetical protein